jgi:hypothetical protein
MGRYDIVGIIASGWPFIPLVALLVVVWFALRWWRRKPPTI